MQVRHYVDLTAQAVEFITTFLSMEETERLTLLAVLMEQMEYGLINANNDTEPTNRFEPDASVLLPDKIDLENGSLIAHEILRAIRESSRQPRQTPPGNQDSGEYPLDVAQSFITLDGDALRVQGSFYDLSYPDKLAVLAELFCQLGGKELYLDGRPFASEHIPNPYATATRILDLLHEYGDDEEDGPLPF